MKQFIFLTLIVPMCVLFVRCAKDDINKGNAELQLDQVVETRAGLNANRPTFFLTSGTWSNYMQTLPPNRIYKAYNYAFVDSITLVKVSSGNAQVFYTNTLRYMAANFDITIHYKSGSIDTLNNVLSKFTGINNYTFIPDSSKDLINGNQNIKSLVFTQRASYTPMMLHYTGTTVNIHNWDVHHDTGLGLRNIGRRMLYPERSNDFEFILNNQP